MLHAAVIYLWHGTEKAAPVMEDGRPASWPWASEWFKPKDRRQNLVRAGALCLAEKDRIARLNEKRQAAGVNIDRRVRRRSAGSGYYPLPTGHVEHKLNLIVRELEAL
ncbi:hypothetical protein SJA_C1-19610 [Sphingobium indicum UT26S]|uniref:Uncharacterized protein n=1 Tax=Sphingobium indicum (strain DSM 16413 / CCM 7287 / MTCC 6362 / UT26 / NBRC 101211 / UT26S) TaxID=452662 RepID=D4Z2G3_SPHIU|nr:hypothetical protein SJA_C1-19610 [Sphingobium indicum UT26S]